MAVDETLKTLRDATGVSILQCKKALEEAHGDIEKAKVILRKQSSVLAGKKADRSLGAGVAAAYTHAGGSVVGAVVLASETDFVSKNEAFRKLAYDIAMQVAAMNPESAAELLEQPFVKDETITVRGLIDSAMQKFGEKIEIVRFERLSVK